MHKTAGDTVEGAISAFKERGYSANYIIDKDGTIYVIAQSTQSTWHAGGEKVGNCVWNTIGPDGNSVLVKDININYHTIGIEVVGATGEKYTRAQEVAAVHLVRWLAPQYDISALSIIAHADVCSAEGKTDGREYLRSLRAAVQRDKPPVILPSAGHGITP